MELESQLDSLQVGFVTKMSFDFRLKAATGFSVSHGVIKVLPAEWVSTEQDKANYAFRYVFHKKCRVRLRIAPFNAICAGSPFADFVVSIKGTEKFRKFINKNNVGTTPEISDSYFVMNPNDTIEFKFSSAGFTGTTDTEYIQVYNSFSNTNENNTYLAVIPLE